MTPQDFAYWLQGYFELADAALEKPYQFTSAQVRVIQRHLAFVFDTSERPPARIIAIAELLGSAFENAPLHVTESIRALVAAEFEHASADGAT